MVSIHHQGLGTGLVVAYLLLSFVAHNLRVLHIDKHTHYKIGACMLTKDPTMAATTRLIIIYLPSNLQGLCVDFSCVKFAWM